MSEHNYDETFQKIRTDLLKNKNKTNAQIYTNKIASNISKLANYLFWSSLIVCFIFICLFIKSLDEFTNISILVYAIVFGAIAPIEKLLLNAKAEQIELLTQINKKL